MNEHEQLVSDGVELELTVNQLLQQQHALQESLQQGLKVGWSFETLAIQAALLGATPTANETELLKQNVTAVLPVDVLPEEILPTVGDEPLYSEEGFKETAQRVIQSAIDFLLQVFNNAIALGAAALSWLVGIEKRIELLEKALEINSQKYAHGTVALGNEAYRLSVMGGVPVDANSLLRNIGVYLTHTKALDAYVNEVPKVGRKLLDVELKGQAPTAILGKLLGIAKELETNPLTTLCHRPIPKDNRFNVGSGEELLSSVPLLGGQSFFYIKPKLGQGDLIDQAEAVARAKVKYINSLPSTPVMKEGQTFPCLEPKQITQVLNQAKEILALFKAITNTSNDTANSLKKSLVTHFKTLSEQCQKENLSDEQLDTLRACIGFSETFGYWATAPQHQFTSNGGAVVRALVTLCHKSINALK